MTINKLEVPPLPYGWKWDRHPPIHPSVTGRYKLTISASRDGKRIYETFWVDIKNESHEMICGDFQITLNKVALAVRATAHEATEESKEEYICELLNQIQGEHV